MKVFQHTIGLIQQALHQIFILLFSFNHFFFLFRCRSRGRCFEILVIILGDHLGDLRLYVLSIARTSFAVVCHVILSTAGPTPAFSIQNVSKLTSFSSLAAAFSEKKLARLFLRFDLLIWLSTRTSFLLKLR